MAAGGSVRISERDPRHGATTQPILQPAGVCRAAWYAIPLAATYQSRFKSSNFEKIFAQGPSLTGMSPAELAVENSQALNSAAAANKNVQGAIGQSVGQSEALASDQAAGVVNTSNSVTANANAAANSQWLGSVQGLAGDAAGIGSAKLSSGPATPDGALNQGSAGTDTWEPVTPFLNSTP